MKSSGSHILSTLIPHFFRRFFDSDTVATQGDTITTVARALAAVAVPGLICAFFLQTQYPRRDAWGRIEDQYLFVLLSFVGMGAVATIKWEMLFPDRIDFLVLTPLSLRRWEMLTAKTLALAGFMLLFLVSVNAFGVFLLPAISKGDFYRQLFAHAAACCLAGAFAAAALLAVGGSILCLLDPVRLRMASSLLQLSATTALTLTVLHYLRYGDSMQTVLENPGSGLRWYPPFWFLAIYQCLLHGDAAPAFAHQLAPWGYGGLGVVMLVALVTYPLAWVRMQRAVIEGTVAAVTRPPSSLGSQALVSKPAERAVFAFIGLTISRTTQYQAYFALYSGVGLALSISSAAELLESRAGFHVTLSRTGLHMVLPLLLFWAVAGLRSAFALPLNLDAAWIFRLSGAPTIEGASAARRWAFGLGLACTAGVTGIATCAGFTLQQVAVQVVCGLCLSTVLTDCFFSSNDNIPFTRPRMPGLTNFPLVLTLYVGVLPVYVLGFALLELRLERTRSELVWMVAVTVLTHFGLKHLRYVSTIDEEDLEGYEEEFQRLGLV